MAFEPGIRLGAKCYQYKFILTEPGISPAGLSSVPGKKAAVPVDPIIASLYNHFSSTRVQSI